jgi:hypothetical protein
MMETNKDVQPMDVDIVKRSGKGRGAGAAGAALQSPPGAAPAAQAAPEAAPAALQAPAASVAHPATVTPQLAPWKKANKQNEQLEERRLLRQSARLALETSRMTRAHTAALHHTAIIPLDAAPAQAMILAGQAFYETHQRGKKQRTSEAQPSSPYVVIWKALLSKLAETSGPSLERELLQGHMRTWTATGIEIEESVHVCKIAKAYQQGTGRISLSIAEQNRGILTAVAKMLKDAGAEWKVGIPPRSSAERAVEQLLARLGTDV